MSRKIELRNSKITGNVSLAVHESIINELRVEVARKQAEIDRLMLEYCPDEMTAEQLAEWSAHQRPAKDLS